MHVPPQHRVLARTQTKTDRVKGVFPDLNRSAFISNMRAVQRAFNTANLETSTLLSSEADAAAIAKRALPMDNSSLQWSPQGSGLSSDIDKTFERLYERYVSRYETHAHVLEAAAIEAGPASLAAINLSSSSLPVAELI